MAAVVEVAENSNSGGTSQKTAARLGYCNRRRKKKIRVLSSARNKKKIYQRTHTYTDRQTKKKNNITLTGEK